MYVPMAKKKKSSNKTKKHKKISEETGLLVPSGLLIGAGIGWIFGNLVIGGTIGLGCGLLAMFIARAILA